ncbi:DsbA family protein [Polaromonas naphthalenivorans]|uniref:DSBA oxidoreductase n=1 Tax=Polaromonas naphthalenivorans (strain CJ2) TaxID=365044 RepID=A1VPZ1_POLNA|nr:DsbA family protein [Polaromonas naphthalenivorans]ABM37719.1 DSBA oxidoreductase [Polaromonas naphthalenivorans CJ2]
MSPHSRLDPLLRPDEATDAIRGPAGAPVTLIEYGDFECPSCVQAHGALNILLAHFGDQLRFVFRHFPLREIHPHAEMAAEAAEAARAQGKFWPMYDLLFTHSQHLKEKHLLDYARQVGLDIARYQNEMNDHVYLQRVQEHIQGARHLGVRSTPAFYVNGVLTDVSFGLQHLHEAIDKALLRS